MSITGLWKLVAQNGDSYDVLALGNGRILAIGPDGIELWPDFHSFTENDSNFDKRNDFIEHDFSQEKEKASGNDLVHDLPRFGESWVHPLVGAKIRSLDHRVITLLDGSQLEFVEGGKIYLSDEKGNLLGLMFNEDE